MGDLVVCRLCGRTLAEHADARPDGAPVPRMPCLGLKSGFVARLKEKPVDLLRWDKPPWFECDSCGTRSLGGLGYTDHGYVVHSMPPGWLMRPRDRLSERLFACSERCATKVEARG